MNSRKPALSKCRNKEYYFLSSIDDINPTNININKGSAFSSF
jgi:hypothetical protein